MHKTKSTSTIMITRADPTGIAIDKVVSLRSPPSAESVTLVAIILKSK